MLVTASPTARRTTCGAMATGEGELTMKGYRKASRHEIKCRDCHYGKPGKGLRSWWRCYYYCSTFASCAAKPVSRKATCSHAAEKLPDTPAKRALKLPEKES